MFVYLRTTFDYMDEKRDYTIKQERLARFAKALGHPARIAIMNFLAKQKLAILVTLMKSFLLQRLLFLSI